MQIELREYQKQDFKALETIIRETWHYDDFSTSKTAVKLARVFLSSCLTNYTFSRVAVVDGNVAGMILKKNENDGDNIHAVSISQILPLVEHLANKETIRYTGIYGTEITQAQCRKLGIDQGLYVERTQEESPAMKAGIQCGDIISKIDGTPTESMQSYYTYLQTKKQGENLTITVLRKNSDGEYAEKDYKVTVGER